MCSNAHPVCIWYNYAVFFIMGDNMSDHSIYENPLITRYASKEMAQNFSDDKKFTTWRKLWIALAEAEQSLGLTITDEQIEELKDNVDNIDYDEVAELEKKTRHDVMAHILAYGQQCPSAKGIIHLGATSCYVGDNTDVIIMRDALVLIKGKLLGCMSLLADFASRYADHPTLGFTHFQPAQLTTVGKRASLWLQDLWIDYQDLEHLINSLYLLGVKGTTGTQASFMTLFEEDEVKVKELERIVVEKMGFTAAYPVTGQTYPRKLDSRVAATLSSIAHSAYKFANDIRLLQSLKEIEEPFESTQIGSSAMAYKRNPMRTERMCALARFVLSLVDSTAITASTQWFERTLDDSANRRLTIPQAFLAADGLLKLYMNVLDGLIVYDKVIAQHISNELPFMATETILMEAVKRGGDRQALHEKIRVYSMQAGKRVKMDGLPNNLLDLIAADPSFGFTMDELMELLQADKFTGRSGNQVREFLNGQIMPILNLNAGKIESKSEINV
jgi:adenylosuccinate lyase